ncbi:MAG: heterodisulfide reductase-related iron-sulfur binding cluster, partial [Lachnospiraceae bacterium]
SCLESLKDLHPDMEIISWYKFAADHPEMLEDMPGNHPEMLGDIPGDHPEPGELAGRRKVDQDVSVTGQSRRTVKVIDPCSSISEPGMAQAVRSLLEGAGYDIMNQDPDPACCGFGGHIYNAVPALHDTFAQRRIEDIQDTDAIAASYCANCRDILAYKGAEARHVLGMLLGIREEKRKPPELGDRRENRRKVKRYFTCTDPASGDTLYRDASAGEIAEGAGAPGGSDGTEKIPAGKEDTGRGTDVMEIMVSEELIRKMDRELILREQVNDIICQAEETSNKLYDEEDNIFIAHQKMGAVTIWVAYSYAEDQKIMVDNVYCHRMEIREDQ